MRQAFIGRRNYSILFGLLFFEEKRDEKNDLRIPSADMLPEVCVPAYANRLPEKALFYQLLSMQPAIYCMPGEIQTAGKCNCFLCLSPFF